jgi:hypothetical protein
MKTIVKPGSRQRSSLYLLICGLLRRRSILRGAGSFLAHCFTTNFLFLLLPALLGSCDKTTDLDPPLPDGQDPPEVMVDSVLTQIRVLADGRPVERLDLFVYDADGLRPMEKQLEFNGLQEELDIPTLPGDKLVVGIANSPKRFNRKALERYDAMEQLSFNYADDDPDRPVLGGFVKTNAQCGEIRLQPLLCCIRLVKVSNTMDGYELLENPCIRLRDLPNAAEILRLQEFRPAELIDAGPWTPLPYDVGYFPQEPNLTLWCYPNDTPEDVLGVPRPYLEFQCSIRGSVCSFKVPLPPLPRACTKEISLTIDGPGIFRYEIQ